MHAQPGLGPAAIRDGLNEADLALLVLRVDRGMAWEDVARILRPDASPPDGAAALERRFQALCEEIRALAVAEGLVPEAGVAP